MTGQKERALPIIDVDNDVYIAYLPLAHILELSCGLLIWKKNNSIEMIIVDRDFGILSGFKMWLFISVNIDRSINRD